jgi:hypothetical protein
MSRTTDVSADELERALQALDWVFLDDEWPEGEVRCRQNTLIERLRERDIPRAHARALIEALLARGVFRAGKSFVNLNIFVGFDGTQTDTVTPNRYLHTTRERWHRYLEERKADGPRAPASPSRPGPASAPPGDQGTSPSPHPGEPAEGARVRVLRDRADGTGPQDAREGRKRTAATGSRDRKLEARDKWLYQQCCNGVPYKEIQSRLEEEGRRKGWRKIGSVQGIRAAALKYAERHQLPAPPSRQNL